MSSTTLLIGEKYQQSNDGSVPSCENCIILFEILISRQSHTPEDPQNVVGAASARIMVLFVGVSAMILFRMLDYKRPPSRWGSRTSRKGARPLFTINFPGTKELIYLMYTPDVTVKNLEDALWFPKSITGGQVKQNLAQHKVEALRSGHLKKMLGYSTSPLLGGKMRNPEISFPMNGDFFNSQ